MIVQSMRVPLDRGRLELKVLVAQHFRRVVVVARHIIRLGQGAVGQDSWLIVVPTSNRGLSLHFRCLHLGHLQIK